MKNNRRLVKRLRISAFILTYTALMLLFLIVEDDTFYLLVGSLMALQISKYVDDYISKNIKEDTENEKDNN